MATIFRGPPRFFAGRGGLRTRLESFRENNDNARTFFRQKATVPVVAR
ncbi:MAG: hypothetical protein LBI10_12810 [Deltaproteobacteria bacterium]|nr:hypothetical protein [Deltaproteobacteria bacterium]